MLKDFRNQGVRVDGIGFQMHLNTGNSSTHTQEAISDGFKMFTDEGFDVYVTELDVAIKTPVTAQNYETQAEIYKNVVRACLGNDKCKALQLWGVTDKYSWIPGWTKNEYDEGLIFDKNYNPKPAFFSLESELKKCNNIVLPTTPTPTPSITPTPIPTKQFDFNKDGNVCMVDFVKFINFYKTKDSQIDANEDSIVNLKDFLLFREAYIEDLDQCSK